MSVKIYGAQYLTGMPIFDYKIEINGVTISLKKDDFEQLLLSLSDRIKADYEQAIKVKEVYDKKIDMVKVIRDQLIQIFYDGDIEDCDGMFFKKECSNIKEEDILNFLEKHKEFMNFE